MGELDLQAPFPRPRPLAEDLEDEPGAVEHLCAPRGFKVALLYRRQRMVDDDEFRILGADQTLELGDLAGAEQGRRPRARQRHKAARPDVEIDGACEPERFIESRFGRTRDRRASLPALGWPCILREHRLEHHRFGGVARRDSFLPVGERPRLALQRFRIGRAQLVSGTLSVAELGQLDGLTRHDRRDGMLVYELRMAVAAEQHAEIIEPSDNALQLHSVHEKYRQRRLRLANVIEKRVLQTLRAFCCHGLPRPLGHAYAVHGPRISSPRWAGHIRRD